MRAFTSARYTVSLGNHSYPMDKYRLVPDQLVRTLTLVPEELIEPEAIPVEDVLRVHTPEYVQAFMSGTLERKAQLRLGLPWSPELVRRAFAVLGGTYGAARAALEDGVAANLARILRGDLVPVGRLAGDLKGDFVAGDLALFDGYLIVPAGHGSSELVPFELQFEGGITGLAVSSGHAPGPGASRIDLFVIRLGCRGEGQAQATG